MFFPHTKKVFKVTYCVFRLDLIASEAFQIEVELKLTRYTINLTRYHCSIQIKPDRPLLLS